MSSPILDPKIEQLVQAIINQTRNRAVRWSVTPNEDIFRLGSDTAIVQIGKTREYDYAEDEVNIRGVVEIFDKKLRLVAEFRPRSRSQQELFDELFDLARSSAHNADLLLDLLLKELSGERS